MSTNNTTMALLVDILPSLYCFVGGLAVGYGAIKCWNQHADSLPDADSHPHHFVLQKIKRAKDVRISDLRSLFNGSECSDEKLVAVRGIVGKRSTTNWCRWLRPPEILVSKSGVEGVALEQTNACFIISNDIQEKETDQDWLWLLKNLYQQYWKYEKYTSLTTVPFILTESGSGSQSSSSSSSDYVNVTWNAESTHLLPLQTVYLHEMCIEYEPILEFLNMFGFGPIGMIEEKMITLGQEVTVVGICSLQNGKLQIKPSEDFPCFLTELTKDEINKKISKVVGDQNEVSVFLGLASLFLLSISYIWARNSWKEWKLRSRKKDQADVDRGNGNRNSS